MQTAVRIGQKVQRLLRVSIPNTSCSVNQRRLRIELLEGRLQLSATAMLLGEEIDMPDWLSAGQETLAQQLISEITTTGSTAKMLPATAYSYPLIGLTDYFSSPNYGRFDGTGYSVAILPGSIFIELINRWAFPTR